jgi:hypothetical protein
MAGNCVPYREVDDLTTIWDRFNPEAMRPYPKFMKVKVEYSDYIRRQLAAERIPTVNRLQFMQLAAMPGKSLAVYLAILARIQKRKRRKVILSSCWLRVCGISPQAKRSALAALEDANLIHVERRDRKNPLVTLLEPSDEVGD